MKYLCILLCCAATSTIINVDAKTPASAKQCLKWQQQLRDVKETLHRGHSAKQGNILRAQERELRSKLHRKC